MALAQQQRARAWRLRAVAPRPASQAPGSPALTFPRFCFLALDLS